jgi:soluble lytic murein transglycosylase
MKRALVVALLALTVILAAYFLNQYWIHRYDALIAQQAAIYRVDPDLVWSVIYEETYFSPWKVGQAGEIGLMQVTPTVAKEWATETGMREFERQVSANPQSFLRDPEHNIQIGCWYLEKIHEQFQDGPDTEARMVAGYNAGPSRAVEWNKVGEDGKPLTAAEFIKKIDIPSTRAYVTSILQRYQKIKGEKSQGATLRDAPAPANR